MEAGDSGAWQSGRSFNSPASFDHRRRDASDRPPYSREVTMATATIMNPSPTGLYHSHHSHPYSPTFPNPSTTPSIAGMISPSDSRRPSDDAPETSQPQRQSLPSLSDVLSDAKSQPLPPPSHSSSLPGPGPAPLPSHFAAPRSSFPERASSAEKDGSPRTLHPPTPSSSFHPRSTGAPLGASSYPQPSPTASDRDGRPTEPPHPSNGYTGHPPPPQPMPYPSAPGPAPPGQLPLTPQYPISPQTTGMPPHPYDNRGPPPPMGPRDEFGRPYDSAINRSYDFYYLVDYLNRVGATSRTVQSFASHWMPIVQEHNGHQTIPARLPRLQEISDMISNANVIKNSLENIRDLVQQNLAETERRGMEAASIKGEGPEELDMIKTSYRYPPQPEVKKRRGRAAPPGRCHSCNRSDTPEWRRGPDGARTLCNACGLHFAKLSKKRQAESRLLRPKPEPEE